jgi:adenylate cyclase, class 2
MTQAPLEAECKFRVDNFDQTRQGLASMGARFVGREEHRDTYLRHPSRDFRATDEALRIREVNGEPYITYKGPRRTGPIKIRPEMELPLMPNTVDDWLQIWNHLGFTLALTVHKTRDVFELEFNARKVVVTLDHVESLGDFVEIERILLNDSEVESAERDIQSIATQLGLNVVEKRSYLGMLLAKL